MGIFRTWALPSYPLSLRPSALRLSLRLRLEEERAGVRGIRSCADLLRRIFRSTPSPRPSPRGIGGRERPCLRDLMPSRKRLMFERRRHVHFGVWVCLERLAAAVPAFHLFQEAVVGVSVERQLHRLARQGAHENGVAEFDLLKAV